MIQCDVPMQLDCVVAAGSGTCSNIMCYLHVALHHRQAMTELVKHALLDRVWQRVCDAADVPATASRDESSTAAGSSAEAGVAHDQNQELHAAVTALVTGMRRQPDSIRKLNLDVVVYEVCIASQAHLNMRHAMLVAAPADVRIVQGLTDCGTTMSLFNAGVHPVSTMLHFVTDSAADQTGTRPGRPAEGTCAAGGSCSSGTQRHDSQQSKVGIAIIGLTWKTGFHMCMRLGVQIRQLGHSHPCTH